MGRCRAWAGACAAAMCSHADAARVPSMPHNPSTCRRPSLPGRLLDAVREAEAQLAPWMPPARLRQLADRRQQLGALLRQLQEAGLRPAGARGEGGCGAEGGVLG